MPTNFLNSPVLQQSFTSTIQAAAQSPGTVDYPKSLEPGLERIWKILIL